MMPFEDLIRELSFQMEVTLHPDTHQSCLIAFPQDNLSIQIDLDMNADHVIVGTQLGRITPGAFREKIFIQAMRANGTSLIPKGILAFSEKNDSLVLYQFLNLNYLNGEKLYNFLQLFKEHAKVWKNALSTGDIPAIHEENNTRESRMFGLRP